MKTLNKLTAVVAAALTCGFVALAGPGPGPGPGGKDKPAGLGGRPDKIPGVGGIPKNAEIPDALKTALQQFNDLRQKQSEIQKEIAKKLVGASAEDKEKIKEQLRANRDKFLEDTKQLRADIREQIKALREKLKDTPPTGGEDRGGKRRGRKEG